MFIPGRNMKARIPRRWQPYLLYCQLLLLSSLGSWELAGGQTMDCTSLLKSSQPNISALQPCVTSSGGAPVVLDGTKRFESPVGRPRPSLDLGFRSSTVLLLPPGAVLEIVSANLTGLRLAKPAPVGVQLLLAVSVQPSASLLLTDVVLETDCATLARYQQSIADFRSANISVVDKSGDVSVTSWTQSGITLANCIITCRRPLAVVSSAAAGSETITLVSVLTDVDLYNALALAPSYGDGSVAVMVVRDLTMSSPLWAAQGLTLFRNVTIFGGNHSDLSFGNISSILSAKAHTDHVDGSGTYLEGRPVLDLQDGVNGVQLANGVAVSLVDLIFINTGMVFGYAPVPFTGIGFVAPFLWFFDFKRTVLSSTKPMNQLIAIDCDIISYAYDVAHMWAWATLLTSTVEPIKTQAAPFRIGVYDLGLDNEHAPALEFTIMEAYGMLFSNSRLVPYSNVTVDVPLTARGAGAALYELRIPGATTSVPVWTHSDLQNVLALAQGSLCSPFTNTTTYIHLFSNISLDGSKWPYAGYNISCNITISGSRNREGGTWLNFNLLSRFLTLGEGATLTFRYLTLFNMPSQQRSYVLGDLTQMTLPLWPVGRHSNSSLLLLDCTVVLPSEEYRMLADVAGGLYRWSTLNSSIMFNSIGSHSMNAVSLTGFGMILSNTQVTDSSGNVPYAVLLGPNIYGTAGMSPPPPPSPPPGAGSSIPAAAVRSGGGGGSQMEPSAVVAIAVAVPLGVISFAAVLAVVVFMFRRRSHARGVVLESPREASSPGVPGSGPGPEVGSKGLGASGLMLAAASSNNTPHSECAASGVTEGPAGEAGVNLVKASECDSGAETLSAPPLHLELHQLILDFAREIEDKHLTIHDALGSGGFATVYRGTWRGIDVAVKVIEFQDRVTGNERLQARAMTEAAIAANIQHSNIVTTYSYDIRPCQPEGGPDTPSSTLLGIGPGPEGGPSAVNPRRRSGSSDQSSGSQATRMWKLYLIQEFCEVGSLRVAVENHMFQLADGQPNLNMILRMMLDVVRGLQHLHRKNIVHGDLTPGNILLKANVSRPGQYVAKLADFGLSVKMTPSQTSVDNNRTGTPFYASPEVRQHGNLTKASDLYALGVVLWEMWHGRPCYQRVRGVKHYIHATGYPTFPPQCPAAYADLAARCLRRPLEERPQLNEVHDVLRNLLGSAVSGLSSSSEGGTSGLPSHEWPFVANFGTGGVVGGMGGVAGFAAAVAALGGAPGGGGIVGAGGVSDGSTVAGDGGGGGGTVGTGAGITSDWFPAALAAGFQAAGPQQQQPAVAVAAQARAGSGRGEPAATAGTASPPQGYGWGQVGGAVGQQQHHHQQQAAAGAGTWPREGVVPHGGGHGPAGGHRAPLGGTSLPALAHRLLQPSPSPLAHAGLTPRLLQSVMKGSSTPAGVTRCGAGKEGRVVAAAAAAVPKPSGGPLPAPAALPRLGGGVLEEAAAAAAEEGSGAASAAQQVLRPGDVALFEREVAAAGAGAAGDGGCRGSAQPPPVASPQGPQGTQLRSSISLKLGTAEEHFVTAPGSNG